MKLAPALAPRPDAHAVGAGLLMLALLALAPAGHAVETETLPKAVTIQQLLHIVREKSPRYSALKQRIEVSRAEVEAAGVMPNPRLNIGNYSLMSQTNTMYEGRTQREIILEVPVLASGQRGARVEAAEKQVEMTEASVEARFLRPSLRHLAALCEAARRTGTHRHP